MIFTGFKRKTNQIFLNKRIADLIENKYKNTSDKAENVLLFLDDNSEISAIRSQISTLLDIPKEAIEYLVFNDRYQKEKQSEDLVGPRDFGWYGRIKSDKIQDILTKKYDLLINYCKVDNLYGNLVLLYCEVGFKSGFAHLDHRFYDLLIDCKSGNYDSFNRELEKFLRILNKIR